MHLSDNDDTSNYMSLSNASNYDYKLHSAAEIIETLEEKILCGAVSPFATMTSMLKIIVQTSNVYFPTTTSVYEYVDEQRHDRAWEYTIAKKSEAQINDNELIKSTANEVYLCNFRVFERF